jgi:hypothetical protein
MSSKNRGDVLRSALAAPTTVATEDFNSFKNHVSNFMSRFQSEWKASLKSVAGMTTDISRLRAAMKKKKGDIRSDAPDIKMRSYAKWLSVNGKMVTDPDHLIAELQKMAKTVSLFENEWYDAYTAMINHASDNVLRHGDRDLTRARQEMAKTLDNHKPAGFAAIMTKTDKVEEPFEESEVVSASVSEYYLGHWRAASVGIQWGGITGSFPITLRDKSNVKETELAPLDLATIEKLLVGIESIFKDIQSNHNAQDLDKAWNRLERELSRYQDMDDPEEAQWQSRQEVIFVNEILLYAEHLMELPWHNEARQHAQVSCTAILAWCEQSLKRMD